MLAGAALALSGCAAAKSLLQPPIALTEVRFDVSPKANGATPFAVELVAVSDETLLAALLTLSAAQWFAPEANLKRDHPGAMRTWYYELTPGSSMPVEDAPFARRGTRAVFLFANYKGKGAYRLRLDATPRATVRFSEQDIELAVNP